MNPQQEYWKGSGGDRYAERNSEFHNVEYEDGLRLDIFKSFLDKIPRDSTILEIGCSRGQTTKILKDMGFHKITGIDINQSAIQQARCDFPELTFIHKSVEDCIFMLNFDLVITSGVLIHIHPDDLPKVIDKIKSLSNKYIFGYEYYSNLTKSIKHPSKCWSSDYVNMFEIGIKRVELHKTKKKVEAPNHSFFLLEK